MSCEDYNVKDDVPPFYLENADTVGMLEIFQKSFDLSCGDISEFINIIDYERAEEKYLDLMLIETGWILNIDADLLLKRKIMKMADYIFSTIGLSSGIIFTVKNLIGVDIQIVGAGSSGFELNNNSLGDPAIPSELGLGGVFFFYVLSPILTADQLALLDQIVDFMRFGLARYEINQVL